MINLKYILLLGIMLVNLMPYLKDGKVEWKGAEVAAQYYTIENTGLGIYICGEFENPLHTIISTKPCDQIRPENITTPVAEPCYCGRCGLQKTQCDQPCVECSGISTVNEDGNDYKTGSNICNCICGSPLSSCGINGLCTNAYCPYLDQTGSNSNYPLIYTQSGIYPCIQEDTYKYGMEIYPITSGQNFNLGHSNWCSVMVLGSILGGLNSGNICNGDSYYDPLTIAQYYLDHFGRNIINNDTAGVLAIDQARLYNEYSENNIYINEQVISHNGCDMYEAVRDNTNSGIIVAQSKADTGMNSGHTLLFYEFYRNMDMNSPDFSPVHYVRYYNTAATVWDDKTTLTVAEQTPGVFKLISKK